MYWEDIPVNTSRVLKSYIDLVESPNTSFIQPLITPSPSESKTSTVITSTRISQHPDIQYFRSIKNKHHFAYHKSKRSQTHNIDKIESKMTVFDPYNRTFLLDRLLTYTALNWSIPNFSHSPTPTNKLANELNELKCARNGWKCTSISVNNNTKNHLICTSCQQQLILKFNNMDSSITTPFEFDLEDYQELNNALKIQYLEQITKTGHSPSCPWVNFETHLEGVYYLRPYLKSTNIIFIDDYLKTLMNLVENSQVLKEKASFLESMIQINDTIDDEETFNEFIRVSNSWILHRYFGDNEGSFSVILDLLPRWFYKLAMYGWDLNIQSFSDKVVLLLICTKCNQRVFLNVATHHPIDKHDLFGVSPSTNLNVSASKILTPCQFSPAIENFKPVTVEEFDEEESDEKFYLTKEHKQWCCNTDENFGKGLEYGKYFLELIISSEKFIGLTNDELFDDHEMVLDFEDSSGKFKRKNSFDINDGLDRLNKLRKLYLIDE